jgi:hypothetical protein
MDNFQFALILALLFGIGADVAKTKENMIVRSIFSLICIVLTVVFLIGSCMNTPNELIG